MLEVQVLHSNRLEHTQDQKRRQWNLTERLTTDTGTRYHNTLKRNLTERLTCQSFYAADDLRRSTCEDKKGSPVGGMRRRRFPPFSHEANFLMLTPLLFSLIAGRLDHLKKKGMGETASKYNIYTDE